jgi:hypothetical protein
MHWPEPLNRHLRAGLAPAASVLAGGLLQLCRRPMMASALHIGHDAPLRFVA